MLDSIPTPEQLAELVGKELYEVWHRLCALIDEKYDMERVWAAGGKAWTYEYKYRRGGKTLCALYARSDCVGFMVIFGKDERQRFEADHDSYSVEIQRLYDEARTYHDGKWLMFEPKDTSMFVDFMRLLGIKRRPNRKRPGSAASRAFCCFLSPAWRRGLSPSRGGRLFHSGDSARGAWRRAS